MTILNASGFETGDSSELSVTAGTFSIQTSTVRSGVYALRVNPTTTGTGSVEFRGLAANGGAGSLLSGQDRYVRFFFNYATKPASVDEPICRVDPIVSETNSYFVVALNSSGNLVAYQTNSSASSKTVLATGTTVLSAGTWYRIEVKRIAGTTGVAWEVKINGTSEISGTWSPGTSTGAGVLLGKVFNFNGNTVDFYYDDYVLSNSSYPGDGKGLLVTPNANGNYQTWTIGAGSGSHFQVVDDIPHNSDTDYLLSTGTSPNAETEALTDSASAGISGTILLAKAIILVKQDGASAGSIKLRVRSGSTDSDQGTACGTNSVYTSCCRIMETDPATSAAWATTGIDGCEVGAVENSANKSRMTMCGLYVDCVPVAAKSPPSNCAQSIQNTFLAM